MPKKRKTRQEKIILQLKRQLAQQQSSKTIPTPKIEVRQEAISKPRLKLETKAKLQKKPFKSIFFYDPRLVRKDLFKSLALTLGVISLEIVLYLKLR